MARAADPEKHVEWRKRLERFSRSKLSVAEFCRREGMSTPSFYRWRQRLVSGSSNSCPSSKAARAPFVPVQVAASADLHVVFPNGARLTLPVSDQELVRTSIEAIAQARTGQGEA